MAMDPFLAKRRVAEHLVFPGSQALDPTDTRTILWMVMPSSLLTFCVFPIGDRRNASSDGSSPTRLSSLAWLFMTPNIPC